MKLKITLGASLLLCSPAVAQDVYPGCEAPTTVAGHHTFFVDPVKGADNGDGSAAHPWKNLNTVLAPANKLLATKSHKTLTNSPLLDVNPTAPIKGGDTIMLMSGNYGDVTLANVFNDKFITVMPAPGAKPVIAHLRLSGAARWMFQGLTFQFENTTASAVALTSVVDGWGDSSNNILFNQDVFQSAENTNTWTDPDWYTKAAFAALDSRSTCVSVTQSTLRNLVNGIIVYGEKTLIKGNIIDKFSTDGIDAIAGKLAIVANTITNGMHNASSSSHPDAIQVWSPVSNGVITKVSSDIVIDSNKVYTPTGTVASGLMGISAASCNNVTMKNNIVAVNHWNGMVATSLTNSLVINNTVLSSDGANHPSYLTILRNTYGPSSNVVVRNNVSTYINISEESIKSDHNAASRAYSLLKQGKTVWVTQTDNASKNFVLPTVEAGFRNWNPVRNDFDVHLTSASVLIGKGSQASAPATDADGRTRTDPVDLGALSH